MTPPEKPLGEEVFNPLDKTNLAESVVERPNVKSAGDIGKEVVAYLEKDPVPQK